jgi:CheY-like chemotaxis protein
VGSADVVSGGKDPKRGKILLYDDKYDSVVRLEEIWKEEGFETESFDDEMTLQEKLDELLRIPPEKVMIPAIDVRFPNEIQFKVKGKNFRITDPQFAGFEIIELLSSNFPRLRDKQYILMSSAEMEGASLERLNALKAQVKNLQFVSKKDPEESVLEKTYELIADPRKVQLFGYLKMFESFCDLLGADYETRARIIGAESPSLQSAPYLKYIRAFIETSSEAKDRISTFMAIELALRALYKEENIDTALCDLKSHKGEVLKQMITSGNRIKQEYVRHFVELLVGGGV